jgi:hypothetical protein
MNLLDLNNDLINELLLLWYVLQVDKAGVDLLHENSGRYVATLEPWIMVNG